MLTYLRLKRKRGHRQQQLLEALERSMRRELPTEEQVDRLEKLFDLQEEARDSRENAAGGR